MKLVRFLAVVVFWSLTSHVFAVPRNDGVQPQRLRVAPKTAAALLKYRVDPEYPWRAPVVRVPDNIFLRIVIDQRGRVIEAAPASRDELATEDPGVREAAVEAAVKAVKQWEYRPYLFNGRPVEVETRVVAYFTNRSGGGDVMGGVEGGVIGGIISSAATEGGSTDDSEAFSGSPRTQPAPS